MESSRILGNPQAGDQNKLRAAALILEHYRKLALDLYDGEDVADETGVEVQQESAPVFSLKVI